MSKGKDEQVLNNAAKNPGAQDKNAQDAKSCEKPALRKEYEDKVRALKRKEEQMRAEGKSAEEIARTLHAERRALGVQYKDLTPPDLLAKIHTRNMEKYGDKLGPSIEWLRARGKTWENIIDSATRPGGKDIFG